MALKKQNFNDDEEVAIFDEAVVYKRGEYWHFRLWLNDEPKTPTHSLFYTQRKDGFTANTLTHIVNGIYKNAGISGATSHSGRRTGLTNLSERGVGVRTLMAIAGHANMSTTQRYIDMRPSVIRVAIELA